MNWIGFVHDGLKNLKNVLLTAAVRSSGIRFLTAHCQDLLISISQQREAYFFDQRSLVNLYKTSEYHFHLLKDLKKPR